MTMKLVKKTFIELQEQAEKKRDDEKKRLGVTLNEKDLKKEGVQPHFYATDPVKQTENEPPMNTLEVEVKRRQEEMEKEQKNNSARQQNEKVGDEEDDDDDLNDREPLHHGVGPKVVGGHPEEGHNNSHQHG
jgi:hypothetical protein